LPNPEGEKTEFPRKYTSQDTLTVIDLGYGSRLYPDISHLNISCKIYHHLPTDFTASPVSPTFSPHTAQFPRQHRRDIKETFHS
jgi:hypothetical protein